MRRKGFYFIVALFAVAVVANASNMGFKITIPLDDSGTANQQWVSLPYYNSYAAAADVKTDIGAACYRVYRWNEATDDYTFYESARSGTNFSIDAGVSYMIVLTASANWVVVGSHDPGATVSYTASGVARQNWVSVPYHTMSANAAALKTEIGANCYRIYRWNPATDDFTFYESARSGTNFNIDAGTGYMLVVNAAGVWSPSHY